MKILGTYPWALGSEGAFSNNCEKYVANWFPKKSEDTEADNEAEDIDIAPPSSPAPWPETAADDGADADAMAAPPPSSLIMVLAG